jgi:membrane-bound metal-dependent hydrolase YbcI (DUF457 family)
MAGFRTHITTSTVLGVGYGVGGFLLLDAPPSTCVLATGLCSVSGMLPDLDSGSGVPVRETMALAAAVVPMLMMDRFEAMGLTREAMVVAGGAVYVAIRFGAAAIFKRYTVHRGMWHSIPAAMIAGLLAFMACSCEDMVMRGFKTGAVVSGFLSHLLLDEIWSVQFRRGRLRFKKSFGTALKFWGTRGWANVSVYAKLIVLSLIAVGDPMLMEHFDFHALPHSRLARQPEDASATMLPAGDHEPSSDPLETSYPPPQPFDEPSRPSLPASLEDRLRDALRFW